MIAKCSQNEFEMSAHCTQKEPQVSKGKDSIDKDSKVKESQKLMTLRYFLDTHNLSSLDERFEQKLANFFYENNQDVSECINYCEFVFSYIKLRHNNVDAKLFFTVSLKKDVLFRFSQNKNERESIYGNKKCPVCEKVHLKNGKADNCTLDLSKPYTEKMISQSRIDYANYCQSTANLFSSIKLSLKKIKEKN